MLRAIIETLRPRQWTKNLVIFAGIIFDGQLNHWDPFIRVVGAFFLLCLVSGLTYTINDILDIKADQLHPQKKNRPIASGRLTLRQAGFLALILAIITLPTAFLLSTGFGLVCVGYSILMFSYSKWLKKIALIDVMVISVGFLLRVAAGILVIKVNYFSPWLFVLTSLLALYLGFGKRLSEMKLLEQSAGAHREVLESYSIPLLNQYLTIIVSGILIAYSLYTFSAHPTQSHYTMMLTIPFVFYGLFRYLYLIEHTNQASAPEEVILNDRPLQITVVSWALAVMIILYIIY